MKTLPFFQSALPSLGVMSDWMKSMLSISSGVKRPGVVEPARGISESAHGILESARRILKPRREILEPVHGILESARGCAMRHYLRFLRFLRSIGCDIF